MPCFLAILEVYYHKILGVFYFILQIVTISTMVRGGNSKGAAAPLDMANFEGDEYALPGWDTLSLMKDQLWTLK
jgi:hypothetical protein